MLAAAAAAAAVLLSSGAAVHADLLGGYVSAQDRDPAVSELLERSPLLRELAETRPALAEMVLQRLRELADEHGVSLLASPQGGDADGLALDPLRRASPTAVLDLIELMKQASKAR